MTESSIKTGLVSITFRKIAAGNLIEEAVKAGQQGIEWGGDVHVPHGDTGKAEQVARWMRDAGLETAAYGSYYRLAGEDSPDIGAVLDSAEALGAPTVRVWAGNKASADADEAHREAVQEDARRICGFAAKRNLRVALEYHGNTLTDSIESTEELLGKLPLDNLDTLWQPPNGCSVEHAEKSLKTHLSRVSNVHVFHWGNGGFVERYPLEEGRECWQKYFEILDTDPGPRWALMEFVKDDELSQYHKDAKALHDLLSRS